MIQSWRRFWRSFADAGRGIYWLFALQQNARCHLLIFGLVILMGCWLGCAAWEWCAVLIVSGLVFAAEALNSAMETLADALHPAQHPLVGQAKDLSAGAVLISAIFAAMIGLVVFLPKLVSLVFPASH